MAQISLSSRSSQRKQVPPVQPAPQSLTRVSLECPANGPMRTPQEIMQEMQQRQLLQQQQMQQQTATTAARQSGRSATRESGVVGDSALVYARSPAQNSCMH